jgi:hypothetical protein
VPKLFNKIKKVNDQPAVSFLLVKVGVLAPPEVECSSCFLQLGSNDPSRVTVARPTIPGSIDHLAVSSAVSPVVLKTEKFGPWNLGGDVNKQRDMI